MTLTVEGYDFTPDTSALLKAQISKISGSGIAGRLKDISWVGSALHAVLVHGGFDLNIIVSDELFEVTRCGVEHLDPNHLGNASCGSAPRRGRVPADTLKIAVDRVTTWARVSDAWANGTVRSTPEATFDIPVTMTGIDGKPVTEVFVNTPDWAVCAMLGSGDSLQFYEGHTLLDSEDTQAFLLSVAETTGATREDLMSSLKTCQAAHLQA